jgi:transposase InsO family protein
VKFAWIALEKANFPVVALCRNLRVTTSGFYAWRGRPESEHTVEDRRLQVLIRASFDTSQQRYGSPRVHADLIERHEQVSRKRVIRLMQADGLKARKRRRYKHTTMSERRSTRRRQSARPAVRSRGAESTVGRRHDRVCHWDQRQALPGGDPGLVLAVRRRLGRERGE